MPVEDINFKSWSDHHNLFETYLHITKPSKLNPSKSIKTRRPPNPKVQLQKCLKYLIMPEKPISAITMLTQATTI